MFCGLGIESIDSADAELAHEDVTCEGAERARRQRQAPGRIQIFPVYEFLEQYPAGGEDIHITVALAGDVAGLIGILERICDVQQPVDLLNIERCISRRDERICERAFFSRCE